MPQITKIPVALQWILLTLEAIELTKMPLPMAARALAMVQTAMYNAWAVYDGKAISTVTAQYIRMKGSTTLKAVNSQKAFSFAACRVLTELFRSGLSSERKTMFRELMYDLDYDPDDNSLDISQTQGIGNLVAKLILERGLGDGSNSHGSLHSPPWSDYTGYRQKDAKADYFIVPYWGLVKSFALDHNAQFRPLPPFKEGQDLYREQAKQILQASAGLTDEQKATAEYWSGNTGNLVLQNWCAIAQFIAERNNYNNGECIKLYFALANAFQDSTIACWESMRYYEVESPVEVIHYLFKNREIEAWSGPGKENEPIRGEDWQPYIKMPPYPGYVSPIGALSSAAAIILNRFTGSDQFRGFALVEKGSSEVEKVITPKSDIKLEWSTFTEAAKETGMAGFYGGISFPRAVEQGRELGQSVGKCVWEKVVYYFNDRSVK